MLGVVLSVLAEAARAPTDSSGITVSDYIATAALAFSVYNLIDAHRRSQLEAFRQDVLRSLDLLKAETEEISSEIERHLCLLKSCKCREDIYRLLKRTERTRQALEARLPIRRQEIFAQYTEWYKIMTGDGFPVEVAEKQFRSTDGRITDATRAQDKLTKFLDLLRVKVLSKGVNSQQKLPPL